MWIIPKNLPTYHSVLATKELGVDSEEFSQMSEKSLMWRSKLSQSQTWSRRWKRITYIQRLSTQILKPSHIKNFVAKWTSYQRGFLASHSAPLAAELPQQILDTCIPTSPGESQSASQLTFFSKTSKELSGAKQPMGNRYSNMSSEIWKKEVTKQRGLWSARVKLALHTSGRGCLSWPTADATNISDGVPWEISGKQLKERRARVKIAVAEGRTKAGSGRSVNLAMAVQKELATKVTKEKSCPTPAAGEARLGYQKRHLKTKDIQKSLTTIVIEDGQQDQGKSSTSGKSRESPSVLNPNWVEQLMGLPVGWTQLPIEWTD